MRLAYAKRKCFAKLRRSTWLMGHVWPSVILCALPTTLFGTGYGTGLGGAKAGRSSLILRYCSDTLLAYPGSLPAPPTFSAGSRADRMDMIAFWLAVVGYIAVWCGIFGPLAWLIRTIARMSDKRAEAMAFSASYVGAVLGIVGPLMLIAANNPSLCFPAGRILEIFHERCPADWCSQLLAVIERPK